MIKFLIEKEFKQIFRNPFLPRMIVMFPLAVMLIFPWAVNMDVKDIRISVVDNDQTTYSKRLVEKIRQSKYFILTDISAIHPQGLHAIEQGKADIILDIAPDFEKNMQTAGTSKMLISANAVNGMKGGLGSSYLNMVLQNFSNEIRSENLQTSQTATLPLIEIIPQNRFNPYLDYKTFIVPALVVMLLTMVCGFLPALNIVTEKETGTIEQINVTPVPKLTFILSKLIPYWIIGFVILSIALTLAALVYGIFPAGNLLVVYMFAALYILVVSGFGLVISNYSDTLQQAMFLMFFFMLILILISGLYTPINSMPGWAQHIAAINPLKYLMIVMRGVYLKGTGLSSLYSPLLTLLGFAIFSNAWAVWSYRKSR